MPERSQTQLLYFLSNQQITRICSLEDEVKRLSHSEGYDNLKFYFSPNGSNLISDGTVVPIEALFSELIFMKGSHQKSSKVRNNSETEQVALCFYFGNVTDLHDLKFINLAIRDLGPRDTGKTLIYLAQSLKELRSEIEECKRFSDFDLEFHQLVVASELPDWLGN